MCSIFSLGHGIRHMLKLVRRYNRWSHVKKFPYYLVRHYGVKRSYKKSQIDTVAKRYRFPQRYRYFAYAMFLNERDFKRACATMDGQHDYSSLRHEVSQAYLAGKEPFDIEDLLKTTFYKGKIMAAPADDGGNVRLSLKESGESKNGGFGDSGGGDGGG